MYYFSSLLQSIDKSNPDTKNQWVQNFRRTIDGNQNELHQATHKLGDRTLSFLLALPNGISPLVHHDSEHNLTLYIVGDRGPYHKDFLFESAIKSYIKGQLYELTELPILYNLIIIDHKINQVSWFADNYHCQTTYYHKHKQSFLASNTLKGITCYPSINLELDLNQVNTSLVLGGQFPGHTLLKDVRCLKYGEYIHSQNCTAQQLPIPTYEKDTSLDSAKCIESLYDLCFASTKPYSGYDSIGLMFSGGRDSASIAKLLETLPNTSLDLCTYLSTDQDMNKENIEAAERMLGFKANIFSEGIDPNSFMDSQKEAIWHGESEAVGVNSLNLAIEAKITKFVTDRNPAWSIGDCFQIELKKEHPYQNSIFTKVNFATNYNLIKVIDSSGFLEGTNIKNDILSNVTSYVQSHLAKDVYQDFNLSLYPGCLYRLRNRSTHFSSHNFILNRSPELRDFIRSIPDAIRCNFVQYQNGKTRNLLLEGILNKLLGDFYRRPQRKCWMESFLDVAKNSPIRTAAQNYVFHDSNFLKNLFGSKLERLKSVANPRPPKHDNLVFLLLSLDIFNDKFVSSFQAYPENSNKISEIICKTA